MDVQAEQGRMLIGLEQRPLVDMAGLARRLEDVADLCVARPVQPDEAGYYGVDWRLALALVVGGVLLGIVACWGTVRYLPDAWLPPGFRRAVVQATPGKF